MKSDDEKLRELFQIEEKPKREKNDFNSIIKRAKFFSTIKTIIISFMIFIIIGFLLLISNVTALSVLGGKKNIELNDLYNISMPNSYIGNWQIDNRIMVGEIDYVRYKLLGNKPIEDGNYKETYTYVPLIKNNNSALNDSYNNYLLKIKDQKSNKFTGYDKVGKHIMEFYHPTETFETYPNDIEKLNEIQEDKLAEMSLSFDKEYSFNEVKNMLPKEVKLNWCWVDTYDIKELDYRVLDEYEVYGFKTVDRGEEPIADPSKEFIETIIRNKNSKANNNLYSKIYNNLSNTKGEIHSEDLKIIGVVVTGDVKSLKLLKNKNYIKASTLGQVDDKY